MGAFAFHQGNCCFHILDFAAVVVVAVVENDAFAVPQYVFVRPPGSTNAVDYKKKRNVTFLAEQCSLNPWVQLRQIVQATIFWGF